MPCRVVLILGMRMVAVKRSFTSRETSPSGSLRMISGNSRPGSSTLPSSCTVPGRRASMPRLWSVPTRRIPPA